ncbi:DUF6141 family protein [Paludibacteraceae bacterium OttesenSCG-928-F17]|nr:DUF6141 family protein [Paludibacteraceae bacterium OttesenSCG-928-F17]
MKNNIEFREKQRMTQWWLWLLMIGINIPFIYGIYHQIFMGEPWGNNPMSDTGLIIAAAFIFLFTLVLLFSFLETVITKHGIYVRYFPFHIKFKYYDWNEISKVEIKNFNAIRNFGGYGVRYKKGMKASYILGGNKAILIELKSGKEFMIGTQKPEETEQVLKELGKIN